VTPSPRTALVVGGGVMGASIAGELARRGVGVTLLEKRRLGAGSSGKSGAILRAFYPQPTLVRMARDSRDAYARFESEHGLAIGFRRPGALFLAPPEQAETLRGIVATLVALGVRAQFVEGPRLAGIEPRLRVDGPLVGAHEPDAAFVDPHKAVTAFGTLATRAGAEIVIGERALQLMRDGSRIVGAVTDLGERRADVVVLAVNAWTAPLLAGAGLTLPVLAVRPEQAYFEPPDRFGAPTPIVCDFELDVYYKDEGGRGVRVGRLGYEEDPRVDPDAYDEGVSGSFVAWTRAQIARRLPPFADATSWGGCGALYGVTPDAQAAIGFVPGVDGLFVAAGFSGHGFKLAPSVGKGVAEWLVDGSPAAFDAGFFDPGRFAAGRLHRPLTTRPILG
jgi:sarcosine oxidase, subunit beta